MGWNGVIETSTGILLRKGFGVDFENDGSFDSGTETFVQDIPEGLVVKRRKKKLNDFSKFDGSNWVTDSPELSEKKSIRADEIDNKTAELISNGFVYDSNTFSLSAEAQLNALGIKALAESGGNITPIDISTKNDSSYTLNNKAALDGWFQAGFGTKKAHLDSGRALKLQIEAATNDSELDAVIDNR